jgi:hypothetical protein
MPIENLQRDEFGNYSGDGRRPRQAHIEIPGRGEPSNQSELSKKLREANPVGASGQPEGEDPQIAEMLANQRFGRPETTYDEMISTASDPLTLFEAVRQKEAQNEQGGIPSGLVEHYRSPATLSTMQTRAQLLSTPNDVLDRRGWIIGYDVNTGRGIPAEGKAGYALGIRRVPVMKDGQYVISPYSGEPIFRTIYEYGKDKERMTLAKAYEKAALEFQARFVTGAWAGASFNLNVRDSLGDLVSFEHGTGDKLVGGHLTALFNMPDVDEMLDNPENHSLGDKVEEALVCQLIMLNSGTKQRMQDFLERPGVQHLISKMHKEEQARMNANKTGSGDKYTRDQWVKDYIGDVDSWTNDNNRFLADQKDASGRDVLASYKQEYLDNKRGRLTRWGNIAAFGGNPGDFGGDNEIAFIEDDIGGAVGSKEASWIAGAFCRGFGVYSSEGYDAVPGGKVRIVLGEGRFMSADDRGKFHSSMWMLKEGLAGRSAGLKGMLGKIPDTAMNLLDWWQVAVDDLPLRADGSRERRSVWDYWLGTKGGKNKIDLLTGKKTTNLTKEEGYHRLGDANFSSADRDVMGTFGIMQWLDGRVEAGVYEEAINVDKFGPNDFSLNSLKKKYKFISIVMNPVVLTHGSMQLYDNLGAARTIQKNFLRNMLLARIHSAHFTNTMLNTSTKLFAKDAPDPEVPFPVVVIANIEEVLRVNPDELPDDIEELERRYIDENYELKRLSKSSNTAGTDKDIENFILDERFEPKDSAERAKAGYIDPRGRWVAYTGPVKGR